MVLVGMICLYFVIMSQQRFTFLNQEKFFYVKNLFQASLVKYFDFFPKTFFQKFELPISECGLSAGVYGRPLDPESSELIITIRLPKNLQSRFHQIIK